MNENGFFPNYSSHRLQEPCKGLPPVAISMWQRTYVGCSQFGFEEMDHRGKAELRLGPCRLVRSQLANGLCTGIHCPQTLAGWHLPLGNEPVDSGQAFAIAGVVMNNDGADIVLVKLLAPIGVFFHGSPEEFESQLPWNSHVVVNALVAVIGSLYEGVTIRAFLPE
jgi:hypothetical protein